MATSAELQAKIERERLELVALRNKAAALPDGPERDAIQAQRDALRAQQKTTTRELEVATSQSPAIGQFEGVDANSGEYRYKNPETGTSFLSPTAPTQAQQQQSGQTAPTPAAPPLPTEARPETAPAEVQTPAAQPQFVETVSPADVPIEEVQGQTVTNVDITAPVDAPAEVVIDEPQNQPLLTPEQSIAQAQTVPAEQDPAAAAADFNANTNASVQEAIGVEQPAPVEPAVAPGATSPFGGAAFNDATARTPAPVDPAVDPAVAPGATSPFGGGAANRAAAQNPEAVAAATQAAQEAQLKKQAAVQAEFQSPASGDWRVRLRLAPGATYLYNDTDVKNSILQPLAASNGVVFPYMPTIQTSYNAEYDNTDLTHSNYRGQFYKSSFVGDIQINGVFTAQDTAEANYLLAVIHFFRSVTKMFYGAKDPLRGAPPPLVYLIGLGQYQFNNQPCVVKTFNYSMPNDCDYIRTKPNNYNVNLGDRQTKSQTGPSNPIAAVVDRLRNAGLKKGALPNVPSQSLLDTQSVYNIDNSTYVPTKCEISITLMPIQTRNQQSKLFNMQDYASGKLLKGGFW
jgi:hypothetical protein